MKQKLPKETKYALEVFGRIDSLLDITVSFSFFFFFLLQFQVTTFVVRILINLSRLSLPVADTFYSLERRRKDRVV